MSNIKPLVGVGTVLPAKKGTVVSINCDSVTVKNDEGSKQFSFAEVEQLFSKE